MVEKHVSTCNSCQRNKASNKKQYGKLPLVPALRNKEPWEQVQVDCCGPWTIRYRNNITGRISTFEIQLLSMADVCTNWSEFARIHSANSIATAKSFDKYWLCRYPRPKECRHDNGNEFMGMEFQEMLASYGITSKPTTVKNPTANAIVERLHGILGEQLRSTIFEQDWSDDVDTLIQSCAYALRATAPSNGIYSPAQLTFGCDMIFRQKVIIDWERLKATRDKQALQNNAKENRKRLEHEYKVGDKVLIILKPYE
jgi:transposase InsO family protein